MSFKKAQLIFIDSIKQEQDFGEQKISCYLEPANSFTAFLKFNKPFYKITKKDNFTHILKSFALVKNELKGVFKDGEIFKIKDLTLKMNKVFSLNQENILLKIGAY